MAKNSSGAALLVMDVQPGIVKMIDNGEQYVADVRRAVEAAHKQNVPVIFVVVGFRPGFPEVSERNKAFGAIKERPGLVDPAPVIEPGAGDVVVTKRRVSAFTGSDLEVVLRAQGAQRLALCGIATSGVVLSTLREAADKDYELAVLADLCADPDAEVHRVLLEKVFPRQAGVMPWADWLEQLVDHRA